LLKDLEITTSEQNEEIKEFIQRAKELAQENKYLEISDTQTQYIYESINQINDEKLF
jgi:CRISPR/Cas system CSM-associated protein Csm2 small subunit